MDNKNNIDFETLKQLQEIFDKQTDPYKKTIKIIQEKANEYSQLNTSFSKTLESLEKSFAVVDKINFEGLVSALNPILENIQTLNDSIHFTEIQSLNKTLINLNYSSVIAKLNQNIQILSKAIEPNQSNENFTDFENIDYSLIQNSEISIAEMSAEINGEEYKIREINYEEFNLMLKTISFIGDPVKSAELLNKVLIIADNSIDYNLKILIFQKIVDEITSLIATGLIGFVIFLVYFILKILLRDNVIFKEYLELKKSKKKYEDND